MPEIEIRVTGDGSPTLYRPDLDEGYHSRHGAVQESRHVFMQAGLDHYLTEHPGGNQIHVFEVGFGTGLNALLAWEWSVKRGVAVEYTSVERYPLAPEVWRQLAYPEFREGVFAALHQGPWTTPVVLDPYFLLVKLEGEIQCIDIVNKYDIIFYDAFAPEKQPELWTTEVFRKMFGMLKQGGILVTYCAKGQVRRNLQEAGFQTERLPGPPGKREMLRGTRSVE